MGRDEKKTGPLTNIFLFFYYFLDFLRPAFTARSVFLICFDWVGIIIQSLLQAIAQKSYH